MIQYDYRIWIAAALLGGLAWQYVVDSRPLDVDVETTYVTGPLRHDGRPDYEAAFLAMYGTKPPPEENGAVEFLLAMHPAELTKDDWQTYGKTLGFEPPSPVEPIQLSLIELTPEEIRRIGELTAGHVEDGIKSPIDKVVWHLCNRPWLPDEFPSVDRYLQRHQERIDRLHLVAKRESFYLPSPDLLVEPPTALFDMRLPAVATYREAARLLAVRANLQIASGQPAAALADTRAMMEMLGRDKDPTIIAALVRSAMYKLGIRCLLLLTADHPDPALAREVIRLLDELPPPMGDLNRNMTAERLMGVDAIIRLHQSGWKMSGLSGGEDPAFVQALAWVPIDVNRVLRQFNDTQDQFAAAMGEADFARQRTALQSVERLMFHYDMPSLRHLFSSEARARLITDLMEGLLLPAVDMIATIDREDQTVAGLAQTVIALGLSARQHAGRYPTSLDELKADFPDLKTYDDFGSQPFVYRAGPDGFALHSIGANGRDDQGLSATLRLQPYDATGAGEAPTGADDIRLTEASDMDVRADGR